MGGRSTRQWMLWAFKLHGCADCGAKYPDIPLQELHCDHRDPASKNATRSRSLLAQRDDGLGGHRTHHALLAELAKCDVVCAPCHRARHRANGHGSNIQEQLFSGTGVAWTSYDRAGSDTPTTKTDHAEPPKRRREPHEGSEPSHA